MTLDRNAFEAAAQRGPPAGAHDPTGLAALLVHAAAAAPERIPALYDEAAEALLRRPLQAAAVAPTLATPVLSISMALIACLAAPCKLQ